MHQKVPWRDAYNMTCGNGSPKKFFVPLFAVVSVIGFASTVIAQVR